MDITSRRLPRRLILATLASLASLGWATIAAAVPLPPGISVATGSINGSGYANGPVSFMISGNAGATIEWSIDGSPGTPGTTSVSTPAVTGDAQHTVQATQTDPLDPTGPSQPASVTFTIDSVAPNPPTFSPAPPTLTNQATVQAGWTGEPGATFSWTVPGTLSAGSGPSASIGPLLSGTYTVNVTQTDLAGNTSAPAGATFTIDTIPPAPPAITPLASNPSNRRNQNLSWTGEIGAAFNWNLAGPSAASGVGSSTGPRVLADGSYVLTVTQTDLAGNPSAPAVYGFTIDTLGPTVVATAGGNATFPVPGDNVTTAFGPLANVQMFFSEPIRPTGGVIRVCVFPCGAAILGATSFGASGATFDPAAPLLPGTRYEIQLLTIQDTAGNPLTGIGATLRSWTFTTSTDATPPGPVTSLRAIGGIGQVALSWVRPTDPDLARITVLRGTSPPSSAADAMATRFSLAPTAGAFTDIGLTPGVAYHYAVYAEDAVGNPSLLAVASAIPLGPPVALNRPVPPKTRQAHLMRPKRGKVLGTLRPLLRWKPRKGAILYNIQVVDLDIARVASGPVKNRGKVISAFPRAAKYKVPKGRLKAGHRFAWRVWAWRGPTKRYVKVPMTSWFDTSPRAKP